MRTPLFVRQHRRSIVSALCMVVIVASAALFPIVRGGELVFLICAVAAAGALYQEFTPAAPDYSPSAPQVSRLPRR